MTMAEVSDRVETPSDLIADSPPAIPSSVTATSTPNNYPSVTSSQLNATDRYLENNDKDGLIHAKPRLHSPSSSGSTAPVEPEAESTRAQQAQINISNAQSDTSTATTTRTATAPATIGIESTACPTASASSGTSTTDTGATTITDTTQASNARVERPDRRDSSLGVVQRFVPRMVLENIRNRGSGHRDHAELARYHAAVGFFDVSGFSRLAHELEKKNSAQNDTRKKSGTSGGGGTSNPMSFLVNRQSHPGAAAEELVDKLNETLTGLIQEIFNYGGDIIKFAGDAILVVWRAENEEDLPRVVLAATTCAVRAIELNSQSSSKAAVTAAGREAAAAAAAAAAEHGKRRNTESGRRLNRMKELGGSAKGLVSTPSTHGGAKLGLHIGIGCGQLVACHVGGELKRWEFFIAGASCSQSSISEAHAKEGQVVISKECYTHLLRTALSPTQCKAVELSTGDFRIEHISPAENSLKIFSRETHNNDMTLLLRSMTTTQLSAAEGYVPRTLIESMGRGGSATVNCLRKLSVIFFKLTNIALPTEVDEQGTQFLAQAQRQVQAVQESAYKYYATLRQFILDDKGFVAIVVLGLPPFFFEDNASRAVKVAARLIHTHKVDAAAGVCTGTVFCGIIGSDQRAEYSVTGDCINLAARFMTTAQPQTVLCDRETMSQARSNGSGFTFDQMESISVKGSQDKTIEVFRPNISSTERRLPGRGNGIGNGVGSRSNMGPVHSESSMRPTSLLGNGPRMFGNTPNMVGKNNMNSGMLSNTPNMVINNNGMLGSGMNNLPNCQRQSRVVATGPHGSSGGPRYTNGRSAPRVVTSQPTNISGNGHINTVPHPYSKSNPPRRTSSGECSPLTNEGIIGVSASTTPPQLRVPPGLPHRSASRSSISGAVLSSSPPPPPPGPPPPRPASDTQAPTSLLNEEVQDERSRLLSAVFLENSHPLKAAFLEGEAGSGKTHLLECLVQETPAQHLFVSAGDSTEHKTPFYAWRFILLDLLELGSETRTGGSVAGASPRSAAGFGGGVTGSTPGGSLGFNGHGISGTFDELPGTLGLGMPAAVPGTITGYGGGNGAGFGWGGEGSHGGRSNASSIASGVEIGDPLQTNSGYTEYVGGEGGVFGLPVSANARDSRLSGMRAHGRSFSTAAGFSPSEMQYNNVTKSNVVKQHETNINQRTIHNHGTSNNSINQNTGVKNVNQSTSNSNCVNKNINNINNKSNNNNININNSNNNGNGNNNNKPNFFGNLGGGGIGGAGASGTIDVRGTDDAIVPQHLVMRSTSPLPEPPPPGAAISSSEKVEQQQQQQHQLKQKAESDPSTMPKGSTNNAESSTNFNPVPTQSPFKSLFEDTAFEGMNVNGPARIAQQSPSRTINHSGSPANAVVSALGPILSSLSRQEVAHVVDADSDDDDSANSVIYTNRNGLFSESSGSIGAGNGSFGGGTSHGVLPLSHRRGSCLLASPSQSSPLRMRTMSMSSPHNRQFGRTSIDSPSLLNARLYQPHQVLTSDTMGSEESEGHNSPAGRRIISSRLPRRVSELSLTDRLAHRPSWGNADEMPGGGSGIGSASPLGPSGSSSLRPHTRRPSSLAMEVERWFGNTNGLGTPSHRVINANTVGGLNGPGTPSHRAISPNTVGALNGPGTPSHRSIHVPAHLSLEQSVSMSAAVGDELRTTQEHVPIVHTLDQQQEQQQQHKQSPPQLSIPRFARQVSAPVGMSAEEMNLVASAARTPHHARPVGHRRTRTRADSNFSGYNTASSPGGVFFRLGSAQSQDTSYILNRSRILRNLKEKGLLDGKRVSSLREIIPSLVVAEVDPSLTSSRARGRVPRTRGRRTSANSQTGTRRRFSSTVSDREAAIDLMMLILDEAANLGTVLIVIEDAHHLDADSWELLTRVIQADQAKANPNFGVRFLVAYRPNWLDGSSQEDIKERLKVINLGGPNKVLSSYLSAPLRTSVGGVDGSLGTPRASVRAHDASSQAVNLDATAAVKIPEVKSKGIGRKTSAPSTGIPTPSTLDNITKPLVGKITRIASTSHLSVVIDDPNDVNSNASLSMEEGNESDVVLAAHRKVRPCGSPVSRDFVAATSSAVSPRIRAAASTTTTALNECSDASASDAATIGTSSSSLHERVTGRNNTKQQGNVSSTSSLNDSSSIVVRAPTKQPSRMKHRFGSTTLTHPPPVPVDNTAPVYPEPIVHFFEMRPFNLRECAVFLSNIAGIIVTEELLSFLYNRSNGNPQSLMSLFGDLQEQDLVRVNPDTGVVNIMTNLNELEGNFVFSMPVHHLAQVHQSFDNLKSGAQLVLKLASVVGKSVPLHLLAWLYERFAHSTWTDDASTEGYGKETATENPYVPSSSIGKEYSPDTFPKTKSSTKQGDNEVNLEPKSRSPDRPTDEFLAVTNFLSDQSMFLKHGETDQLLVASPPFLVFDSEEERFVIYNMLLHQYRKQIHSAVLEWYDLQSKKEYEFGAPLLPEARHNMDPGHLGYHALLADKLEDAFDYFVDGIRRAIMLGSMHEAHEFLQQCEDLVDDRLDGRHEESASHTPSALAIKRVKLDILFGHMHIHERRWDEASKCLRAAMKESAVGIVNSPRRTTSRWSGMRSKMSCTDLSKLVVTPSASQHAPNSSISQSGINSSVHNGSEFGPSSQNVRHHTGSVLSGGGQSRGGSAIGEYVDWNGDVGMEKWALVEMAKLHSVAKSLMESIVELEAAIQARVVAVEKLNTGLLRDGMVDGGGVVFWGGVEEGGVGVLKKKKSRSRMISGKFRKFLTK